MASLAVEVEEVLGLEDNEPSDAEILFPSRRVEYKLLDETEGYLELWPWSLGRFVKAQAVIIQLSKEFAPIYEIFKETDVDNVDMETFVRLANLILPQARDIILVSLTAPNTFEDNTVPPGLRQFVDELPLAVSVRMLTIILRQNWRQLKNVSSLDEMTNLIKLASSRPSSKS